MDLSLKSLAVPLPEDLAKLKGAGHFTEAQELIDSRLSTQLPRILRERLELERVLLQRIPPEYRYTETEALSAMQEAFHDVKASELQELRRQDAVDWYLIDGAFHYKNDFIENLVKTRPAWAARLKSAQALEDREGNFSMLDAAIAELQEKSTLSYSMTVELTLQVKAEAYCPQEKLSVHLPLPIEYAQAHHVELLDCCPEPQFIAAAQHPQRTLNFQGQFPADQVFRVRFRFENHMHNVDPQPDQVAQIQPNFYTQELEPHIVFTPFIRSLCREIIGSESNPLIKARKIYDYITQNIIYSYMRPYFTMCNIPEYCLSSRKGDCGVLGLSFITLCRCAGIPARWQSGLYANPLSIGNHDWAQYYIEPYGWLYADCSFGGAAYRAGNLKRWNFYATNLDPFRIPFASEFQYPMSPEKHFLRNDPYDNQNGEAEYESHGLLAHDCITSATVLEIKKL